jgi:hypothetical protein
VAPISGANVELPMMTTVIVQPLVALIAGILILIIPRLLNYIVASTSSSSDLPGCCRTWATRRVPEDPHGRRARVPPLPNPAQPGVGAARVAA